MKGILIVFVLALSPSLALAESTPAPLPSPVVDKIDEVDALGFEKLAAEVELLEERHKNVLEKLNQKKAAILSKYKVASGDTVDIVARTIVRKPAPPAPPAPPKAPENNKKK